MIHISSFKCVGCGLCIDTCPQNCIKLVDGVACVSLAECRHCKLCVSACPQSAIMPITTSLRIAIGTNDGTTIQVGDHFGMSAFFQVWVYENEDISYLETRENKPYREDDTQKHGDPGKAKATASVLECIDVIVGSCFGPNIARLRDNYVCAVVRGNKTVEQGLSLIKENINEIMEQKQGNEKRGIVLCDSQL